MSNLLNEIEKKQNPHGFIKVTESPVQALSSEQKALLNRKGNVLFNQGDIEGARRIYTTTGYSDGLTRVGDKYLEKDRSLDALKQYVLAHNKNKAEPIYEKIASVLQELLKSDN